MRSEPRLPVYSGPKDTAQAEMVCRIVGQRYGVSVADLQGPDRSNRIASARHLAIWLLRRICGVSLSYVEEFFYRDHTSTAWAEKAVDQSIARYPEVRERIGVFEAEIRATRQEVEA